MTDQRERTLLNGLSFRVRPCSGMAPSQSLIDEAKGNHQQGEQSDGEGGNGVSRLSAYLPHLTMSSVGFADLVKA